MLKNSDYLQSQLISRPRPGLYQGRIIRPNLGRGRSYDDWSSPSDPDDEVKGEVTTFVIIESGNKLITDFKFSFLGLK